MDNGDMNILFGKDIERFAEEHRNEMTEDLMRLIRVDSSLGKAESGKPFGEGAACVFREAEKMIADYGFTCKNHENYVLTADLGEGGRGLDILAHLDVVPGGTGWSVTSPFLPVIRDGNVYGRGAADDKGPAVAVLYAMRAVKELNIRLEKSVRLILGGCEECGGNELEYYYSREPAAPAAFSPDAEFPLINCERGIINVFFTAPFTACDEADVTFLRAGIKKNMVPGTASARVKGLSRELVLLTLDTAAASDGFTLSASDVDGETLIELTGEGCHSAEPENGRNALTEMLRLLTLLPLFGENAERVRALSRMFPYGVHHGEAAGIDLYDSESGRMTASLNMLTLDAGGFGGVLDCRAPVCASKENCADVLCAGFEKAGFTLKEYKSIKPHLVPAQSPLVKTLLESYERVTGVKGEPIAIGGGTYVHELSNGVAFGCAEKGTDNRMHGADEFMSIDCLVKSVRIFADAIISLCREE